MSFPGIKSLLKFLSNTGRQKRRETSANIESIADARAKTRKEINKLREAAVSQIESELSQLKLKAGNQ